MMFSYSAEKDKTRQTRPLLQLKGTKGTSKASMHIGMAVWVL